MALPEEPLSIVEQWKKKSSEMVSVSDDSIMPLLSRAIDTMTVVLNKKAALTRVQRALYILECERSASIQFDHLKNDEVRSLVYGLIESLHFTLSELSKERNQVKECGEVFTQTEEELCEPFLARSLPLVKIVESAEMFTQTHQESSQPSLEDPLASNNYADQSQNEPPIISNWFELLKEEIFDENAIKVENIWGNELAIKDEEIPNDHEDELDCMEVSDIESDFENEDGDETMNNSNAIFGERMPDDNVDTHNVDRDIAGDKGDASRIAHNDDRAQSEVRALNYVGDEPDFENDFVNEAANDTKANEIMEEDREQDSSETVEAEKKRRSSRNVSRPVKSVDCESLEYSDEDSEPTIKKSKADASKMKISKSSDVIEKESGPASSEGNAKEMKCTECEYQTTSAGSFIRHLRYTHFTTLKLSGLALLCDCGVEFVSNSHAYKCDIANFTVIRKRDGPIQRFDDHYKTTPQKCVLCEKYPTTACGYVYHLRNHHNASPSAHGIWLECSCGTKYRTYYPDSKHKKKCNPREYTLHKVADK